MKKKFLTLTILCILVIAVTVASTAFAHSSPESNSEKDHSHINDQMSSRMFSDDYLIVKNRKNILEICIDNSTQSVSDLDIKSKVENTIDKELRKHERWGKQGLDKYKIEIVTGCDFEPILLHENSNHVFFSGNMDSLRLVDEEVIKKHFNGTESRLSPEEFMVDQQLNEIVEVTSGIYVTDEEFRNQEFIKQLRYVLGLDIINTKK
jgi:hypothetical protein